MDAFEQSLVRLALFIRTADECRKVACAIADYVLKKNKNSYRFNILIIRNIYFDCALTNSKSIFFSQKYRRILIAICLRFLYQRKFQIYRQIDEWMIFVNRF